MRALLLFLGIAAILGLGTLLIALATPTGNAVLGCPKNYTFAAGYCVENACKNSAGQCIKQNGRIQRPECTCTAYFGKFMCGIPGGEKTHIKSPLCTRRGSLGRPCGAYDSNLRRCVTKSF
jgi:hypothetical protein